MRAYVERCRRRVFASSEARRQSLAVAERARDPEGDEAASLRELEAFFDEDHFAEKWKA